MLIPRYNQGDHEWRSTPLGTKGHTIGSAGCTLTCLGMVVGEKPPEVLKKAKAVGAISPSGDFTWYGNIQAMYPNVRYHNRISTTNEERSQSNMEVPAAVFKIKKLLMLGQPVIVRVDVPGTLEHFVVITGWNGTDFILNDPNGGKEYTYKERFGDILKTLLAYVILIGPERESVDCGPEVTRSIIQDAAGGVFKAAQLASGKNVATYSKEILDQFL